MTTLFRVSLLLGKIEEDRFRADDTQQADFLKD